MNGPGALRQGPDPLAGSRAMAPVEGSVDLDLPADVLGDAFFRSHLWPRWNACMAWVGNRQLRVGDQLVWVFEPIRRWYPYLFPAIARIVEVEPGRKVSWEVTALPGFFARHTYTVTDLGGGRSRLSSWEQATGPTFRAARPFWLAHFRFVRDRSLQGGRLLEAAYRLHGALGEAEIPRRRRGPHAVADLLGALELLRLRAVPLAPDLWAVLGGGGNSVVLRAGGEALLVDPKMPPFAHWLHWWIGRRVGVPVTRVIDTHHHFDHTFGNPAFAGATVVADTRVPALMHRRDGEFWRRHPDGVPAEPHLVSEPASFAFGDATVTVHPLPRAHTDGDVWVDIAKGGRHYVATGDVGSVGHYLFFDAGEGGADLQGWADAARRIAEAQPDATVVPGHGRIGTPADLRRLAAFVEFLRGSVAGSLAGGLDDAATARNVDLSSWRLRDLPVFHYGERVIGASSSVRRAAELARRARS